MKTLIIIPTYNEKANIRTLIAEIIAIAPQADVVVIDDDIVTEAGGRLYPAKDARMPRTLFETGYPRLGEFLPFRDPGISSSMSRRLLGS